MVILAIGALMGAFFAFGGPEWLSVQNFKENHVMLASQYEDAPLVTLLIFGLVYTLTLALNIPVSAIFALAAGALFGFAPGIAVIMLFNVLGATLAFWLSRYVLAPLFAGHLDERIKKVNRGVEKDGAYYLFALRVTPIVPYWLINLAAGLSSMKTRVFSFITLIGSLPILAVYVFAGTRLATIKTMSDILSWDVIFALCLLGGLPLLLRYAMRYLGKENEAQEVAEPDVS